MREDGAIALESSCGRGAGRIFSRNRLAPLWHRVSDGATS